MMTSPRPGKTRGELAFWVDLLGEHNNPKMSLVLLMLLRSGGPGENLHRQTRFLAVRTGQGCMGVGSLKRHEQGLW